jgi:hypothetical protein
MSLFDDLIGNFKTPEQRREEERAKDGTYNVYVRFDNDEDVLLYNDVNNNDAITFTMVNSPDSNFISFKCPNTGKSFKLFCQTAEDNAKENAERNPTKTSKQEDKEEE